MAAAAVIAGLLALGGCQPQEPPPARSVLLVVVDTLRADHLGVYGHTRPTSPSLDRRAEGAVIFERTFSTSSWTLPAIASILTGRLPVEHGARSFADRTAAERGSTEAIQRRAKTFGALDDSFPTLATLLASEGYATAAVTSNPFLDRKFGLDRGFDSYDQVPRRKADAVTDAALEWLRNHHGPPFFLFVHYMDPHLPYRAPADLRGRFTSEIEGATDHSTAGVQAIRNNLEELPPADRELLVAAYDEEVLFVDRELERLLAFLQDWEAADSTLVVLTSDHGEEFFEHGGFEHGHSLHDEVLRVPLLFWDPRAEPGRREVPTSLADLLPTILDALGIEPPSDLAGSSLWPLLLDSSGRPGRRLLGAQDILHGDEQLAVVDWPRKLILRPGEDTARLFDLAADPAELHDLAADQPAVLGELREDARRLLAGTAESDSLDLDAATLKELRALGYIQ